jgi:hypothetical protein
VEVVMNTITIRKIVEDSGAEYVGVGTFDGIKKYVMFNEPNFKSSLILFISELTIENVKRKLISKLNQYSIIKGGYHVGI